MRSIAWVTLLRFIPEAQHNNLSLTTKSGVEMSVAALLRIDHEFVAFRGRLSGSQDAGRLFCLPYSEIDYLGFQREIKEAEFHELFDTLQMPALSEPAALPALAAASAAPPPPAVPSAALAALMPNGAPAAPPPPPNPAADGADSPATRMAMPIKSAVLERFRQRGPNGSLMGPGQQSSAEG